MFFNGLYKSITSHIRERKAEYFIASLVTAAILMRVWFYSGLIFSDDAYYDQLAFTLLKGEYASGYIGYPGFLLRVLNHILTALSFLVFGSNELASIMPSFIFSIFTIFLIYKISLLFDPDIKTASLAAFLWAFFPLDIIFASLNFAEPKCAFLLNLGAYLLIKAALENKIKLAALSGLAFYASFLLKEYFFFFSVLLTVALIYFLFRKNNKVSLNLAVSLGTFGIILIAHSFYYMLAVDDFFYYSSKLKENFVYAYYDFFPASAAKVFGGSDYFTLLAQQIMLNIKHIFLRRHNLGLPALGLALAIFSLLKKKLIILSFWFLGLSLIFIFGTTSFKIYTPLNLYNSWVIYPLVLPLLSLISVYIMQLNRKLVYIAACLYIIGSVYVSYQYKAFFDVENKKNFKTFIAQNADAEIYTDHHTKYAVDLIRSYENASKTKMLNGGLLDRAGKNSLIIYNEDVIKELKMQGHKYPGNREDFKKNNFKYIGKYGNFEIYKKI